MWCSSKASTLMQKQRDRDHEPESHLSMHTDQSVLSKPIGRNALRSTKGRWNGKAYPSPLTVSCHTTGEAVDATSSSCLNYRPKVPSSHSSPITPWISAELVSASVYKQIFFKKLSLAKGADICHSQKLEMTDTLKGERL